MFTGLVQALGTVATAERDGQGGMRLQVSEPGMAASAILGESIAVNGVCLTVVAADSRTLQFQVGPETLDRTNLGNITPHAPVNLERALRVGDAIGGHFVSGHVDAVGTLRERQASGDWQTVWFTYPPQFFDLLVIKGSIAIDGVSLTVVDVERDRFSVMLIPHTLAHTTLGSQVNGGAVNLEFDLLAKHVQKLFQSLTATPRFPIP
ncbi:MAG: riboflavin synthase [Bacteroidales bacterium]|nr:riboflavin synthase [Bacteroidales bacterium]